MAGISELHARTQAGSPLYFFFSKPSLPLLVSIFSPLSPVVSRTYIITSYMYIFFPFLLHIFFFLVVFILIFLAISNKTRD